MSLAGIIFLNPWILTGLGVLPALYWLLRTVPPTPRKISFPPTRLLIGLENKEKSPSKTPWWLILIRLLAAGLLILGLADPVLNPPISSSLKGKGPIILLIDNGWSASPFWSERLNTMSRLIDKAQTENRQVGILTTAQNAKMSSFKISTVQDARIIATALAPQPYAPDRISALNILKKELEETKSAAPSIFWLTDGLDHDGQSETVTSTLLEITKNGDLQLVEMRKENGSLGLATSVGADGKLIAKILSPGGALREGKVIAYSSKNQRLAEAQFKVKIEDKEAVTEILLPLELRNQVTRVEIAEVRSAGTVSLLDQRSQWQRIGLISGEQQEKAQPLLGSLYYIQKALKPFAELSIPNEKNLDSGLRQIINDKASIIILTDIGTLSGDAEEKLRNWVGKGGVLVRFAGPKLENGGDSLLPAPLRSGGRSLGGAMSWLTPQPINEFEESSLFSGLQVPQDITIKRQVLADPALLKPEVKIWARLKDGTPIVTSAASGNGQIILFHTTANSEWSNLPMSGLFVEMLRRILELGSYSGETKDKADPEIRSDTQRNLFSQEQRESLSPFATLDGFGSLKTPPPTALPLQISQVSKIKPSFEHPPGYYGTLTAPRAVNVLSTSSILKYFSDLPEEVTRVSYDSGEKSFFLKPWALATGLGLIFMDIIIILLMLGTIGIPRSRTSKVTVLFFSVLSPILFFAHTAKSEEIEYQKPSTLPTIETDELVSPEFITNSNSQDRIAVHATSKVTLGYIITGNSTVDQASELGLSGLTRVLQTRTAVEPGPPQGINILSDEIAFYPILYWPVLETAQPLPQTALAKIDAYMKQGGMIIFDTRDYANGLPEGVAMAGENGPVLQRLIGQLDIPRLEPVPENHVLTKSFYIMDSFPGRWEGGQLWVEAQGENRKDREALKTNRARQADGVSSILISSNDFASAWALDDKGRPLYPVVPGGEEQREMAFRAGINIVMHALTGNYKADQVHVPALLERLGQ